MGEVTDDRRLLLVGASVRAAAFSAFRAGFQPIGVDLFGDADLRDLAEVNVAAEFPRGLTEAANSVQPCRWLYAGGLENHPRTVAAISRRHHLLGNPSEVLRAVRNPFRVAEVLRRAGLPVLEVRRRDAPPSPDGGWVIKPRRSGGGRGIVIWDNNAAESTTLGEPHYFQERFAGTPISAVFIASPLSCRLVGITRQLIGESGLHASPFAYCGSLGPLELNVSVSEQIDKTGRVMAEEFQLRGLFGIDFLADKTSARTTEINPRYTASVEVLEYALGLPLIAAHVTACESFDDHSTTAICEKRLVAIFANSTPPSQIIGKAILFADRPFDSFRGDGCRRPGEGGTLLSETPHPDPVPLRRGEGDKKRRRITLQPPGIADIPQPGTAIKRGDPVCTVFASAENVTGCLNALFQKAYIVQQTLSGHNL